jgi:hypothetical protein
MPAVEGSLHPVHARVCGLEQELQCVAIGRIERGSDASRKVTMGMIQSIRFFEYELYIAR